jgi:hypothetical protein
VFEIDVLEQFNLVYDSGCLHHLLPHRRILPAATVNFNDSDGNELEFLAWLQDAPNDIGFVPYLSEWNELNRR